MIHIAIVDDDLQALDIMEQKIQNDKELKIFNFAIDKFNDIEMLRNSLEKYDIFFLDIDMPIINGINIAKEIKSKIFDAIIIFMTNRNDLMHLSFSVQPFYFIRKSNFSEDCEILFSLLVDQIKKTKREIILVINERKKVIKISSIVYVESFNHYINIHLKNGEILVLKKRLLDILSEIGTYNMVQIHKSYIVNLMYIDYIKGKMIFLKNKNSLPLGRKYKEQLIQNIERHML